jgi:hypothetical protein
MTAPSPLHAADSELGELKARFPGWRIWYVPHVQGPTVWCAAPRPTINCGSVEELIETIEAVKPGSPAGDD